MTGLQAECPQQNDISSNTPAAIVPAHKLNPENIGVKFSVE
jgi:hypothetical protein